MMSNTLTAAAAAVLVFGCGIAHADKTDDAFVKDLQARGITLPANASPSVLGTPNPQTSGQSADIVLTALVNDSRTYPDDA